MALRLQVVTHSEIGLVRKNNQDSGYASPYLLVVADGMGGAAAGDLASAVAVEVIRESDGPTAAEEMLPVLAGALRRANDRIAELVEGDPGLDGMGTTVTSALFDGAELGLAHIGDSRAYLFRDDRLEQLTHDHSWVQSLVDDGKISEAEAAVHPHRSLLLKVLNGQPLSEPDLTRVPVQAGDRLLFCSDGLCGLVGDDDLADALRVADPQRCLRQLVADAHAEGGIDNITIVLADVVEGEAVVSGDTVEAVVLGAAAERAVPPPPGRAAAGAAAGTPGAAAPRGATAVGAGAGRLGGHDDESRYNPQPPHQRRLLRPLVGLLVVLLVLGTAVGTAYAWGRTQYYVGAQAEQVAIFQGLPERVVVPLSRVFEVQSLAISDLPPYYADQVHAGIEVASLASARETVAQLREAVQRCNATTPSPSPSPKPGVTPRRAPPTKAGPVRSPTPVRPEDPPTSSTPTPIPTPPPTPPAGPGC